MIHSHHTLMFERMGAMTTGLQANPVENPGIQGIPVNKEEAFTPTDVEPVITPSMSQHQTEVVVSGISGGTAFEFVVSEWQGIIGGFNDEGENVIKIERCRPYETSTIQEHAQFYVKVEAKSASTTGRGHYFNPENQQALW